MSAQLIDLPMWEEFEQEARKRRRDPKRLLAKMVREQLEDWEEDKLFEEIREQAQKSGYKEEDAVELVRQYRIEKKQARAGS